MGEDGKRAGAPGSTIGSWTRHGLSADVEVPVGLERLLIFAAQDETLRERLIEDRAQAVAEFGLVLSPTELATLQSMPPAVLQVLVNRFRPEQQRNTRLVSKIVGTIAGTAMLAASCHACGGVDPEIGDWTVRDAGRPEGGNDSDTSSADAATDAGSAEGGTQRAVDGGTPSDGSTSE